MYKCIYVFHIHIFIFNIISVCPSESVQLHVSVSKSYGLNKSCIHIGNRPDSRGCLIAGLEVCWGAGQLIAGDYKPQSTGLVSGFNQTNTQVNTHSHSNTTELSTNERVCLHTSSRPLNTLLPCCWWCEPNLTSGTTHTHKLIQVFILLFKQTCMNSNIMLNIKKYIYKNYNYYMILAC